MADVIPLGPVIIMADVVAIVADVVTTVCKWNWLADVIANVADVIATSV